MKKTERIKACVLVANMEACQVTFPDTAHVSLGSNFPPSGMSHWIVSRQYTQLSLPLEPNSSGVLLLGASFTSMLGAAFFGDFFENVQELRIP